MRWFAKAALFVAGCVLVVLQPVGAGSVAAMLAAFAASCLWELLRPAWARVLVAAAWAVLTVLFPLLGFFWPLLVLGILGARLWWLLVAAVSLPVAAVGGGYSPMQGVALLFLLGLAVLLSALLARARRLEGENRAVRDDAVEARLALEQKNRELLAAQEENMKLATLTERGRIAREIHDNVGHLLARGMMLTGALMAVNENEALAGELLALKETLTAAMNSVRESVHDLHAESLDLYATVRAGIRGFSDFDVNLNYDMGEDVPQEVKACFVAVVREALANTARHSDAKRVNISLQEHPGFYMLSVFDNGTGAAPSAAGGMGLENMRQRTEALGGRFTQRSEGGFGIHITVPKKGEKP